MSATIIHSFWVGNDLFYWRSAGGYYYLTTVYGTRRISYTDYYLAFSECT